MANRTISDSGGTRNWNDNASWVQGSPPDNTMDVIATATSGNIIVNTGTCVCKTLTLTGYTKLMTFTASQTLTVSGNVVFASTHTLTGIGTLAVNAAANLTSGTLTFPGNLILNGTATYALQDAWTITGTLISSGGANVLNSQQITVNTSFTATTAISGTTLIVMGGTGTISTASAAVAISNSITVNTAGTITIANFTYQTGTLYWHAGAIAGPGRLTIFGSCSLNTASISWPYFILNTNATVVTLLSDLYVTNNLCLNYVSAEFAGSFNIHCANFFESGSVSFAPILTIKSGQTLYVTNSMYMFCGLNSTALAVYSPTIQSKTATSKSYLIYTGTQNNSNVTGAAFNDIDASASTGGFLINLNGGTLTRCTGIVNYVPVDRKIGYTPVGTKYGSDGASEMLTFKPASVS